MKLQGWAITGSVVVLVIVFLAIHFAVSGWSAASITSGIDATGRSSLILFSIAFIASSLHRLWTTPLTTWALQNRRWIGLSFAGSHFIHLSLILAISLGFPEPFLSEQSTGKWVFGGLGYLFLLLMALTSTNSAQRWMGMKNWKRLHLVGSYWLWAQFLLTYVEHTKEGPRGFYLPFLAYTLLLLILRLFGHRAQHTPLREAH